MSKVLVSFKNTAWFLLLATAVPVLAQHTISGVVRGGADPLPNAVVNLTDAATAQLVGSDTTDAVGVYSFSVGNGTYNLEVEPPAGTGFGDAVVNGIIVDGTDVTQHVVLIEEATLLSGILKTPLGEPIPNARVQLYSENTGAQVGSDYITEDDGSWSFAVTHGDYRLNARGWKNQADVDTPNYWSVNNIVTNLSVTGSTTLDLVPPFITLTGRITDQNGSGVAGVKITQIQSFNENGHYYYADTLYHYPHYESDADGYYTYVIFGTTDPNSGTLVLLPPVETGLGMQAFDVDLSSSANLDFSLAPGLNLGGIITLPDNTPVDGMRVDLHLESGPKIGFWVDTDVNGAYNFIVAPDTYKISGYGWATHSNAPVPGYFSSWNLATNVVMSTGDQTRDFVLPIAQLTGAVTDSNGTGVGPTNISTIKSLNINGVNYYMDNKYNGPYNNSDASGNYQLPLFTNTENDLSVTPPEGSDLAAILVNDLSVMEDTVYDIVLPEPLTLEGRLLTSDGEPVPEARLRVWDVAANIQVGPEVRPDETGYYSYSLVAGTYNILVRGWERFSGDMVPKYFSVNPLIVSHNLTRDTQMDLILPTRVMTGKTTDSNGVPVPGVSLASLKSWNENGTYYYVDNKYNGRVISNETGDYKMVFMSGVDYIQSIEPPAGSGFAQTQLEHLDMTSHVLQNIILGFIDNEDPLIIAGPYVNNITDTSAVIEWQTNEPASSDLYFGTNPTPSTLATRDGYRTNHSITLENLSPATRYYIQATATDTAGNGPVTSSVVDFDTMSTPDTDPPLILDGPIVTSVGHDSATIQWTTSEPATSRVDYGTTANLGMDESDSALTVIHETILTGLNADTVYNFTVSSVDGAGNGPVISPMGDFRTLPTPDVTAPLIIAGPMAINITDTEATVVWETNEPATSGVSYNDGTAYGVVTDDQLVTEHAVRLTGLTPETFYNYTVSSTDGQGNGPTLSNENNFTTLPEPDTSKPIIIEGPIVLGITHQSAVIRWKTDEPADTVIEYGTDPDNLDRTASRAALVTNHNLPLVGLDAGTTWYFRVLSTDAAGNGPATSDVHSFKTRGRPDRRAPVFTSLPTLIDKTDTTATIYWETDEPADTVVDYGQNGQFLRRSKPAKTTRHQVTIAGLQPGASYSLAATSTDMAGNSATETSLTVNTKTGRFKTGSFTTDNLPDTQPPIFTTTAQVVSVSDTTAMIRWETDEIADTRISYGVQGDPLSLFTGDILHVSQHLVLLTNLQPSTTYNFVAGSSDVANNGPTNDSQRSFTTDAAEDLTPPSFSPQPATDSLTDDSAVIIWGTDEFATSQVDYGLSGVADTWRTTTSGLVDSHNLTLTNLEAGLTYSYQVSSRDSAGNGAQSTVKTFTTTGSRPQFNVEDAGLDEGDSGQSNMTFTVTLSRTSTVTIGVDYATVEGTATEGVDYDAVSGTLTFDPGDISHTVSVPINGDTDTEDDETFTLVLSNPVHADGPILNATGTITDDDLDCALITADPLDAVGCTGDTVNFGVTATGTGPFTYQWRKDGIAISGATAATYSLPALTLADVGSYDVLVDNGCGAVASGAAQLDVTTAPDTPAAISGTDEFCAGASESYSIPSVAGATGYSWTLPAGAAITSGAGTNSITVTFGSNSGNLSVTATNECGSSTASTIALTLSDEVAITQQAENVVHCPDESAIFSVTATGAVSYQWRKDGVAITGATAADYSIASVSAGDAGNYDCVVTGACGSLTSNAGALTVNEPVAFSAQPANVTTCVTEGATFSVTAGGSDTLTYQWRKNGVNIDGATNAQYTIAATAMADAGNYDCVVTNVCGSTTSGAATLDLGRKPEQPGTPSGADAFCAGTTETFSIDPVAGAETYTWTLPPGASIVSGAGTTAVTVTFGSTAGDVSVAASNSCGVSTASSKTMSLTEEVSITDQPQAKLSCPDETVSFRLTASGAITGYQWRKDGVDIPGATGSEYSIAAVAAGDAGRYVCVITGTCGTETSVAADLTVKEPVSIVDQPQAATRCPDEGVTFTVNADGSGPLIYTWRKNGAEIPGATGSSFTISSVSDADAGSYDCVITGCTSETTAAVQLTVNQPVALTTVPINYFACPDETADFMVTVTGVDLQYQWRKDGVDIPGATQAILTLDQATPADMGNYDCVIQSTCGTLTSPAATLEVGEPADVAAQPQDTLSCPQQPVSLSVTASGTGPFTYQWRKDGMDIPGADGAILDVVSMLPEDEGSYDCLITNACGNVVTSPALLDLSDMTVEHSLVGPAQGLTPLTLGVNITCASDDQNIVWMNLITGDTTLDTTQLLVDPMVPETTTFEITITDNITGDTRQEYITVLVSPDPAFQDLNGDGCNSVEDLYMVLPDWNSANGDANNDGNLNLLDYLYINTSGSCN